MINSWSRQRSPFSFICAKDKDDNVKHDTLVNGDDDLSEAVQSEPKVSKDEMKATQTNIKLEDKSENDIVDADKTNIEGNLDVVKQEHKESTPEIDTSFDEDMARKRKRKARPKKVQKCLIYNKTSASENVTL